VDHPVTALHNLEIGQSKPIDYLTFSQNGEFLVSVHDSREVTLWQCKDFQKFSAVEIKGGDVTSLGFLPLRLFMTSAGQILEWQYRDQALRKMLFAGMPSTISLDGRTIILISPSADSEEPDAPWLVIKHLFSKKEPVNIPRNILPGEGSEIYSRRLKMNVSGTMLAIALDWIDQQRQLNPYFSVWKIGEAPAEQLWWDPINVDLFEFSPSGKFLAYRIPDERAIVINDTTKEFKDLWIQEKAATITSLAFSWLGR
jgi:hypothetical protein